jgi:glycosyltransferase involved in cell wall biosynthesis
MATHPNRPRLLVVGDALASTGFARVLGSVLPRLAARYDVHQIGVNYWGDPHDLPWSIYPASTQGDHFGTNRLGPLIETLKPQLVLVVADLLVARQHAQVLKAWRHRVRTLVYLPVESGPVETLAMAPILEGFDRIVTYTQYAAGELNDALDALGASHPVAVIGHGVDTDLFHPLPGGPRAARRALFPDRPELWDGFFVLNANRNQPRKRIDVTLAAFADFARDKPQNVRLYLHMARQDSGWDIQLLARRFGIADRLIVTNDDNNLPDVDNARLNLVYNACDVGVNTAQAEGWGLVSFEHAATGAAQVVPRHTAMPELWDGAAELVPPRFSLINERTLITNHYVASDDVAHALQRLYADPAYRQRLGAAGRRNACAPQHRWDAVAARFDAQLAALLSATDLPHLAHTGRPAPTAREPLPA